MHIAKGSSTSTVGTPPRKSAWNGHQYRRTRSNIKLEINTVFPAVSRSFSVKPMQIGTLGNHYPLIHRISPFPGGIRVPVVTSIAIPMSGSTR